jgi:hypothetical protein
MRIVLTKLIKEGQLIQKSIPHCIITTKKMLRPSKVYLLYELGYVIPSVGKLTEEKACVSAYV